MISKIKDLFLDEKTVYVFDVDGTLTPLEFGEYNHYLLNDEEWSKSLLEQDFYTCCRPITIMQDFLNSKDKEKVYVVTKVMNEVELIQKKNFLKKYYGILPEHVFLVYQNDDKLDVMKEIQLKYPDLEEKYFVMIDDTVDVLNHIMDYSSFSTVHISSFFE